MLAARPPLSQMASSRRALSNWNPEAEAGVEGEEEDIVVRRFRACVRTPQ
jgi:hypothetical protein